MTRAGGGPTQAFSTAVQTLHGKAESALGKEQAAHRAARARMTKAEERIVLERAARQDLERRLEDAERKLADTDRKLKEAQAAMMALTASDKVGTGRRLTTPAFSKRTVTFICAECRDTGHYSAGHLCQSGSCDCECCAAS